MIEIKQLDRSSADCSTSHNSQAMPLKVLAPTVTPRVEKKCRLIRQRVNARKIRTLASVAGRTGKCQVVCGCNPAMLPGPDMVDRKGHFGCPLRHQAVFATCSGPGNDQLPQPTFHIDAVP